MKRRVAFGMALFMTVVFGLGGFLLLRQPQGPPEAEGRVWLAAFADRLASPTTWSAKGPAALALFPGLGTWSDSECVRAWSMRDASAPVVTYQRLELGQFGKEPCNQAQFGMLSTTLRQSDGITPGALVERFTEQFGPPEFSRDTGLSGSIKYTWQVHDGIFATLEERVQPGGADDFSVLFVRSYASPTSLASRADGEQWMDRTVDLVTGPALPSARGAAVVPLLKVDMQPVGTEAATCPTMFEANLLNKGPIATGQSLILERLDDAPCEQARFSWFSMRIWQRDPVTAAALAKRFDDKLSTAALWRDFDRNSVKYRWTTPHQTAVELTEDLSASGHYWLSLRAWRL